MQQTEKISVKEAVESRHSIRKFKQGAISKEDLQEMIRLAGLSASAWNLQPWRFHVIVEPEMKHRLQDAAYGQQQVTSAPAVIMVASDMEDVLSNLELTIHPGLSEQQKQQELSNLSAFFGNMSIEERGQWGLTQTNIALGFLLLSAQGAGYSTVPMLGFDPVKVKEILGLPEYVKFAAMVPIGLKDSEGYAHHRFDLDRIAMFH